MGGPQRRARDIFTGALPPVGPCVEPPQDFGLLSCHAHEDLRWTRRVKNPELVSLNFQKQ